MDKKWYIKIWTMRKYLDLWSVNHILAGSILASLFIFFNAPFLAAMAISFFILLGWEFYEITHKLHETIYNRICDMIVGMAGFFITNYLVSNRIIENRTIFVVAFTVFVILELWGFTAFEKIKNGVKNKT
jgi:hypothetical protein